MRGVISDCFCRKKTFCCYLKVLKSTLQLCFCVFQISRKVSDLDAAFQSSFRHIKSAQQKLSKSLQAVNSSLASKVINDLHDHLTSKVYQFTPRS